MRLRKKLYALLIILYPCILTALPAFTQVVAGIRANGKVMNNGDTVRVCEGSAVTWQSAAQGSMNITWQLAGASGSSFAGLGPFTVAYPLAGMYTTWQKITAGNLADSMFVIVQVSNSKPVASFNFSPDDVCGHIDIQFTANAGNDQPTYVWTFGDGNSSTLANPVHSFLDAIGLPGTTTYPAKLVVTNLYGCKDSATRIVTIKKVPEASIGNADNTVQYGTFNGIPTFKHCANIPSYVFSFNNQSSTTSINSSYTIQWGDSSPDTTFATWPAGSLIKHIFLLGSSTVTVKVTGQDGCIGIKKYIVFLGSTPAGGLASLGNTDVCASDSLRFAINNISGNPPGTQYSFLINDGTGPVVFQHPPPSVAAHFFSQGSCSFSSSSGNLVFENAFGAYLTIENPCGVTSPSVVPIYVSGKPRASMSVSPSETLCTGTPAAIISTSTYGATITPTGGTSSVCTNSGKQVWTISPATGYTITGGSTGSLNGSSTNGGGWTNGSAVINLTFNTTGTYTIKLYVFNDRCGLDSTFKVICVRNPPQAQFTMSSKSSCGKGNAVFSNTSPPGGCLGDKYTWTVTWSDPQGCGSNQTPAYQFIQGTTTTSASPNIQFNEPGRYIIRLTVTAIDAALACPESYKEDSFFVKGLPKATINAMNAICVNNSINPVATASACYSPGPFGYQWTFTNGTPASSTNSVPGSILYNTTGTQPIQLVITDSSCNTSTTVNTTVTVIDKPVANAGNDQTICSGQTITMGTPAVNGVTYQWSPVTGINNPALANPVLQPVYNGTASDTTYGYKLTASIGSNCATEDSVYITVKRKPQVSVTSGATAICIGNSSILSASGADTYAWQPAGTFTLIAPDTISVAPVLTTVYSVTGTLNNGCADTARISIMVHPDARAQFTATGTTKCAPVNLDTVIQVTPFTQGNGTYTWYANNTWLAANSTAQFPSYAIYGQAQNVTIKLVAQSPFGCKPDSSSITFHTIPGVTAAFTKDITKGCSPLAVTFTNTSSQLNGVQFYWNFGNGVTSTQASPSTITYTSGPAYNDTTYYIILKAYNGCDTTYYRDSVKVLANAKARFSVDATKGCSPFAVTISNRSAGNNFAYYWNFGDGYSDTSHTNATFTHIYHAGTITTFNIRLIAQNQCGRDTQTIVLLVLPNSIDAQVMINGNQLQGCAPHTATFSNSSTGAAQLNWNFGDGSPAVITSNAQNAISHTFTNAGVYTIRIELQNDCTDTVIFRKVTVHPQPTASFTLANPLVCSDGNVATTNTSQNATGYEWLWGDGLSSSGINDMHAYASAGTYAIKLVAKKLNNTGMVCTDTALHAVTITNKIKAQMDVRPGKACVPYTLQVSATGAVNAQLVEWTFYDHNGSYAATGTSAAHVYSQPGTYWVKQVVHTAADCADSTIYNFEVHNTPAVQTPLLTGNTCSHDTTMVFNAAVHYTGNDGVHVKWFVNNNLEGMDNPFSYRFRFPAAGTTPVIFNIRVLPENEAGCGDTTTAGAITLQPLPAPSIAVSPARVLIQPEYTFTFRDTAPYDANKVYRWDMGDRTRQQRSGRTISYQYADTGRYLVQLYVQDYATGCDGYDTMSVRILYTPGYLYVPNAMCVGCSDHALRQFLPMGKGLAQYRLRIFNSWGQKLFETSRLDANGSPSEPWDGRYNGTPLQQDTYGWQIEAHYLNGAEWQGMLFPGSDRHIKAGFITIIK